MTPFGRTLLSRGSFIQALRKGDYSPRGDWLELEFDPGALLSIQEMGTPVVFAASDADYEKLVIRLANRPHKAETQILPLNHPPY